MQYIYGVIFLHQNTAHGPQREDPSDGEQLRVFVPPKGSFTSKVIQRDKSYPRLGKKGGVAMPGRVLFTTDS